MEGWQRFYWPSGRWPKLVITAPDALPLAWHESNSNDGKVRDNSTHKTQMRSRCGKNAVERNGDRLY